MRQQLVEAIEPDYVDALRDSHTHMVQDSIPVIIVHLQQTYGKLTDEDSSEKEDVLKAHVYNPSKTIDGIFNKIMKHQDRCILMKNPLSDKQQVNIAYEIFNRSQVFQNSLMKWN